MEPRRGVLQQTEVPAADSPQQAAGVQQRHAEAIAAAGVDRHPRRVEPEGPSDIGDAVRNRERGGGGEGEDGNQSQQQFHNAASQR